MGQDNIEKTMNLVTVGNKEFTYRLKGKLNKLRQKIDNEDKSVKRTSALVLFEGLGYLYDTITSPAVNAVNLCKRVYNIMKTGGGGGKIKKRRLKRRSNLRRHPRLNNLPAIPIHFPAIPVRKSTPPPIDLYKEDQDCYKDVNTNITDDEFENKIKELSTFKPIIKPQIRIYTIVDEVIKSLDKFKDFEIVG